MKFVIKISQLKQVFDTKAFKAILKKCPKIRCIGIDNTERDFSLNNKILELIVKYCRQLTEIYFHFDLITIYCFNRFIAKFGHSIRKYDYYSDYYFEFEHKPTLLDNCYHIEQLNLLSLYTNYSLFCTKYFKLDQLPRLKCLVFWLWLERETQVITKLIDHNRNTLEVIHIWVYTTDEKQFEVIFAELTKLVQLKSIKFDFNIQDKYNRWSGYLFELPDIFPDLLLSISEFCPNINNIEIITYAEEILCQKVYETIQHFARLKRLKLHFIYSVTEESKYHYKSEFLRKCKQLTHLSLDIALIYNDFFTDITENIPKLQFLSLSTVKSNFIDVLIKRLSYINCLKNIFFSLDYWNGEIEAKLLEVIVSMDYSNSFKRLNNLILNNNSKIVFDIRNSNHKEFNV